MNKIALACLAIAVLSGPGFAAEKLINACPDGFKPLFNGKDLSGWWGLKTESPHKWMALPADQLAAKKKKSLADIRKHWRVEGDELVNDG
ncbi:MAG: hypothetical protein R3236_10370, partial [Phycisphaeraceae bacterium]|nr:hypothetical protein [Phycisphaeraceae bacterium]